MWHVESADGERALGECQCQLLGFNVGTHAHKMIRQKILVASKCTTKIYNDVGEHTHEAGDYDNDSILGNDYSRNFQS